MTLQRLESVVEGAAAVYGATAKLNVVPNGCPAVINHKGPAKLVTDIASEMIGVDRVNANCEPLPGSEDFAFMLEHAEVAYFFLGKIGQKGGVSIHNAEYDFNDEIIPIGASIFTKLVEHELPPL
ncbi:M20/M25/M40 family metallo-hydrolase [Vibrio parahaemolyticus]|nr:M20/M25/M40 family metallo-hydrolase [Vibrio parahaemolyticus]EJF9997028.1 M20/M25/M40 family metallo-hydrolase [Vibrio parahaemolyticus]EJG0200961.1 M20/M25/M40 family metallo-hydrolase [Vibrio parahaemolyticus]EJG0582505.1 M20/M25/M40 family metallo-hydrolase [Vibrio parahaemolyticus]